MKHDAKLGRRTTSIIDSFLEGLEEVGIRPYHLRRRDSLFDIANFLVLSGYLEAGHALADRLSQLAPLPFRHKVHVPSILNQEACESPSNTGNGHTQVVIAVFRVDRNEADTIADKLSAALNSCPMAVDVRAFCANAERTATERDVHSAQEGPITSHATAVASSRSIWQVIADDMSIPNECWVLVDMSIGGEIESFVGSLLRFTDNNTKLAIPAMAKNLDTPFWSRRPERIISFATRLELIRRLSGSPALDHPLLTLLAIWRIAKGQADAVRLVPAYFHNDGSSEGEPTPPEAEFVDRLASRVAVECLVRNSPATFGGFLTELPYVPGSLPLSLKGTSPEFELNQFIPSTRDFDILTVTDFRIRGGGVRSVIEELRVLVGLELRVAVMHLDAVTLKTMDWAWSDDVLPELHRLDVPILNGLASADARLTILRYPPTLAELPTIRTRIRTETLVVVVNQPPKRMNSHDDFYDPLVCNKNARDMFESEPIWWPNGPEARHAMEIYSEGITISEHDWGNVVTEFASDAEIEERVERIVELRQPVVIGRHTRDVLNKWPSSRDSLLACYPPDPLFKVHVLGGAHRARRVMRKLPNNWDVWEYGELAVSEFLRTLSVYVFFPHEDRIEPMARCVLEAMAAGMPVILPTRFQGMYGDSPLYREPNEVVPSLYGLVRDPIRFRELCYDTRSEAICEFGPQSLRRRLDKFGILKGD